MVRVSVFRATKRKGVKAGCWRMRWRGPDGRNMSESTDSYKKGVAIAIARKKEEELALDPWGLVRLKRQPKAWAELVAEFLAATKAKRQASTATAYEMSLATVTRILHPKRVGDLTAAAVDKYVASRVKEVVGPTVNKDLRALRTCLRFADKRGYAKAPSFADAFVKVDKTDPVCLTLDTQQKLVAAVTSEKFVPRIASKEWWRVFLALLNVTGARRGELLGLTWDRIDLDGRTIKVRAGTSKSRRDRTLPLPAANALWELLTAWRQVTKGERVFSWAGNTYRSFYLDWKRLQEAAGVTGVVPKNLRSTTASELVAAGVGTMAVKDFLGHASVTTTEQFYANTGQALKTAAEQRQKWREKG